MAPAAQSFFERRKHMSAQVIAFRLHILEGAADEDGSRTPHCYKRRPAPTKRDLTAGSSNDWVATRDTAGSAAAPAARCRKFRRGSFILNLPLPSHHSITSSARASTVAGMSRLSALAVFRL